MTIKLLKFQLKNHKNVIVIPSYENFRLYILSTINEINYVITIYKRYPIIIINLNLNLLGKLNTL